LGDQWPVQQDQLVTMLVGSGATARTQVRVIAAIGAMIQPAASVWWLDLDDARTKAELIDAATAVIDGPRSTASDSPSELMSIPSKAGTIRLAKAMRQ
jgi:hypothetical protein